jgi:hypothetical protein
LAEQQMQQKMVRQVVGWVVGVMLSLSGAARPYRTHEGYEMRIVMPFLSCCCPQPRWNSDTRNNNLFDQAQWQTR